MRVFIAALTALLFVIALFGLGFGVYVVMHAAQVSQGDPNRTVTLTSAILTGIVPFLIGTVALAGTAVTCAVLYTGDRR